MSTQNHFRGPFSSPPGTEQAENTDAAASANPLPATKNEADKAQQGDVSVYQIKPRFKLPFTPQTLSQENVQTRTVPYPYAFKNAPLGASASRSVECKQISVEGDLEGTKADVISDKKGPLETERIMTKVMPVSPGYGMRRAGIEQAKTMGIPVLSQGRVRAVEQMSMASTPPSQQETGENDAVVLPTVSIRAVARKRTETIVKTLVSNIALLIVGAFFIGAMIAIIIFTPYAVFKISAFIALLIALSHIVSVQVRRVYRIRQQKFLTTTQLLKAMHKDTDLKGDEDMKHLKLIKEDTTTYLRALRGKDLKRGKRK